MNGKWSEFRPSKTLWFWSCAGCAVLTMILGFTMGGWVTGGTAAEMAMDARDQARMQLAADVCVARFRKSDGFATALADLKAEDSWTRDDFVADGGWVTLAGMDEPVAGAADLCAEALADMEAPAEASADAAASTKG